MHYVYDFLTIPILMFGAGLVYLGYGHLRGRK